MRNKEREEKKEKHETESKVHDSSLFFFLISFYRCPLSCCAMVFCCPIDKRSNLVLMAVLVGLAIYKYTYINI